ncbi:carboxypeptidase-like regulatory domain-containing protein [Falsiroseomonas oryziterrae]|uniref:carboxypeptidase-like regulatory domain-containing protein n=1 Tax=Falsiroseomonas oryziterrae TaxID=2911368 RepID=UPI001F40A665|nr:carboxypeptidase-like regulatory domain-containing protein [Roseomonas sp. NPKOSM-4]
MAGLTLLRPGDPRAETEEGMVIFSALRGVVLARGRPVPGARVVRSWHWGLTDERGGDAAVTDAEGRFGLPAVVRRGGLRRWLPHEPFVEQTIDVVHGSATQAVWMLDRRNYRPGGELGPERSASALAVTIELDAPLAHRGPVYGRATIAPLDPAVPPPA